MKCRRCQQVSDWIGSESKWEPVHDNEHAVRKLFECTVCGHRQHNR